MSKIEEGLGLVFPGEQLLNLEPCGPQSTTVEHFEETLLESKDRLYKTVVKATWPAGSALRGDSWMKSRCNEIPRSRLADREESLCDVKINDGTKQPLRKRVQNPQNHESPDISLE